jgi:hypothetical protein
VHSEERAVREERGNSMFADTLKNPTFFLVLEIGEFSREAREKGTGAASVNGPKRIFQADFPSIQLIIL